MTASLPLKRLRRALSIVNLADQRCGPAIKAVDSMIPIGRGQRELIIGDASDR